jgi:hypothetical protein
MLSVVYRKDAKASKLSSLPGQYGARQRFVVLREFGRLEIPHLHGAAAQRLSAWYKRFNPFWNRLGGRAINNAQCHAKREYRIPRHGRGFDSRGLLA